MAQKSILLKEQEVVQKKMKEQSDSLHRWVGRETEHYSISVLAVKL